MYGGVAAESGVVLGDCFTFDASSKEWAALHAESGPKPPPRWGHSAVQLGETMLVHGGRVPLPGAGPAADALRNAAQLYEASEPCGDVWVLNLRRRAWSYVEPTLTNPRAVLPRGHHTANLIVFGGAPTVVVLGGETISSRGFPVAADSAALCLCVT